MKNQNIYVSIVIIIVAIALGVWLGHRSVTAPNTGAVPATTSDTDAQTGDKSFSLSCDSKKSLTLTFHLPEDKSVDIATDDGRTMMLGNTSTSDTASYASADGKTVLALAGATLSLTESGTMTYKNCVLNAPTAIAQ